MRESAISFQSYKIGLVVDRKFGERLSELARSFHVWAVESPDNTPVIQRVWEIECSGIAADPLGPGITSFEASELESPEDMCARIASDLDEHHGEFAHDPPWSEIEVFGVKLSVGLQDVFEDFGATVFEPTHDGFICRRKGTGFRPRI
jgi:hypothetical protein